MYMCTCPYHIEIIYFVLLASSYEAFTKVHTYTHLPITVTMHKLIKFFQIFQQLLISGTHQDFVPHILIFHGMHPV